MRLIEKFSESIKVLNDYRNLYHAESSSTEQYKVANAINDILPEFCRLIENDAEPIVHGHWVKRYKSKYYHCSVCGGLVEDEWHNCPHCRAKMDEEQR